LKKTVKPGVAGLILLTAEDLMSKAVLSLTEGSLLQEAVHLFIENHVSAAPVLDTSGKAVGVITKTDLARFEAERRGLPISDERPPAKKGARGEDLVRSWMTPFVMTVAPDESLAEIARLMVKNGLHHIFVKKEKKLIGIISSFDVLRLVSRALNSEKNA
jgi:CBS domain-containing protein